MELGVRQLPQQEVGEALLAGRADQQVGVAPGGRVQLLLHGGLVDVLELGEPFEDPFGEQPRGAGDLGTRRVRDAQVQREARALARVALDALDRRGRAGREAGAVAEHVHPHPLPAQLRHLPRDVFFQQVHQGGDLGRGPLPVLVREREQGEHFHARLDRPLHNLAHRAHAGAVSQRARQVPLARPTSVAIHDDGDVARHRAPQTDLCEEVVAHVRPP